MATPKTVTRHCVVCGQEFAGLSRYKLCSETCAKVRTSEQAKRKRAIGFASGMLYGKPIQEVIFARYAKNAEKRGLAFGITLAELVQLWGKPCTYCGAKIETIGLDRINSEEGYIPGNIVACCTACNLMKRAMLPEEFITHCVRVAMKARRNLLN